MSVELYAGFVLAGAMMVAATFALVAVGLDSGYALAAVCGWRSRAADTCWRATERWA